MIHEEKNPEGYIDLIDSTSQEVVGRKYRLTASKTSVLCNERFAAGEMVEVLFPSSIDMQEAKEEGGPWEGFSSKWLKNNALEIRELHTGVVIHRAPYSRRFLGKANSAARCHALKSILRRFMEGGAYGR
ncbi:MAG: hypothetical protein RDV48_05285 [Candidatus Eremiobacteraeota bacterium]|nr:hypothetical protein [Candidatus Eremiobacteraeota bacterium]